MTGRPRGPAEVRGFTKALLRDLKALRRMLREGRFETGVRRIGAEQELFLIDDAFRPASKAMEVLDALEGPYTTELGLYNLEANVEPRRLEGRCFRDLEARVSELVEGARTAARSVGAEVLLTGILPTLVKSDVTLDNMTPKPRYRALDEALATLRRDAPYRLHIQGTDELRTEHDSVMLESCNTSFQVHLQVDPGEFAHVYNVAQVVTAPVLAACVNSPLLFGKRLWDETRIALFQQSVDTRSGTVHTRDLAPRVRFGEDWVHESVVEVFEEDAVRFRALLTRDVEDDPLAVLDAGGTPELQALQLHNGTVYRWNRPCYGVGETGAHLRIECRVLPAGPTVVDEVANAAFWIGAVLGGAAQLGDVRERIDFGDAKANFLAAARNGLRAGFRWLDEVTISAPDLILQETLPLARAGLTSAGVDPDDIDRYLTIVRERVWTGTTGARWLERSLQGTRGRGTRAERLAALTAGTLTRQKRGAPGHTWDDARIREGGGWRLNYLKVEQIMTTSLYTVNEEELVDVVAFMMDRKQIRHVLVEDDAHALVGIVSYRSVIRIMANGFDASTEPVPAARDIMERRPVSVAPETSTLEAIRLMRQHKVSALPVVKQGRLVGIVTERDMLPIAYDLLEERLAES